MSKRSSTNYVYLFLVVALLLVSCSAPNVTVTSEVTVTSTSTPVPSVTPIPPTETPIPPTATPSPSELFDLDPNSFTFASHAEKIGEQKVTIDGSLVTDTSLDPIVKKVTVEAVPYAEFLAQTVYNVWVKDHPGQTIEQYLALLSEVQSGKGNPLDVAIPMYANDANDGIPYLNPDGALNSAAQKKYWVIPWYTGEVPISPDGTEVRAISEINIVLVNGKKIKSFTPYSTSSFGIGLNLDKTKLVICISLESGGNFNFKSKRHLTVANNLAALFLWIIKNTGGPISSGFSITTEVEELQQLLMTDGKLTVSP